MRHHPDQDIVATFRLRRRNVVRAKFTEGSDHEELYNREKPNQHPIEAITDLAETLELKQNLLISGTNIKTINNESILGEGNIDIQGGGGGGGNVDDVQVNGTSVVSNKVADIKLKTINGNDISGEGNIAIKTYQPFNSNWTVNSTTAQLCSDINNDNSAVAGMAYLGILRNSDLPNNMMQADAVIEIIGESGGSKVIHITITSADQYPYRWEYSYFNEHSVNGWVGFQPELPDQDGQAGKALTTNGYTLSWNNPNAESIKNQNNLRTTPVKIWTGSEAQFKQNSFANWQEITPSATLTHAWSGCYGANKYIFVKGNYEQGNDYIYSIDGTNWIAATSALESGYTYKTKTKWIHDRFISLNYYGNYEYSFDGISWTTGVLPIVDDNPPWDITYGNGKYVVVFQNAYDTSKSINKIVYSTDCENWTVANITNDVASINTIYWRTITFFKGKFIAFRLNSNMVAYSEDAINWTTTTIVNEQYGNYYWVANSDDVCVAVCNGRPAVCTSTDEINWTERSIPDGNRYCILYDGVRFIILPGWSSDTETYTNKVLISTDGINWEYSDKLMPVTYEFVCGIYGNNKLVGMCYDNSKIYVQNYIPLSTTNPDYLSFVEDTKIQLGNNEIVNTAIKQDTLVSGTNIKTINGNSILGSGNLDINALPDQTGKNGKYLKTDGTDASWEDIELPSTMLYEAATVAITGDYNDLTNKPTIPTVNNATITITQGGTTKGSFTLNQNSNATIALDAGGGGTTETNNLFDIKTISQAIPQKNWACVSSSTRQDLSKNVVPNAYNEVLEKYRGVDSSYGSTSQTLQNLGVCLFDDGYYYYYDKTNTKILRSTVTPQAYQQGVTEELADLSVDLSDLSVNSIMVQNIKKCYLDDTTHYWYVYFVIGYTSQGFAIYDNNWNYKDRYVNENSNISFYSNVIQPEKNGITYGLIVESWYNIKILKVIYNGTNVTTTTTNTLLTMDNSSNGPGFIFYDNKFWLCDIHTAVSINKDTLSVIKTYTINNTTYDAYTPGANFVVYNNNLLYLVIGAESGTKTLRVYTLNNNDTFTQTYTDTQTYYDPISYSEIVKVNNKYYIQLSNTDFSDSQAKILITSNFMNFEYLEFSIGIYDALQGTPTIISNDKLFVLSNSQSVSYYIDVTKKVYTETINGTTIKYYKNGDWKITIPNIDNDSTNDTNLQTVYNFLGYLNVWRIDTTLGSENITLPRNSNLWTFMYVGDDYIDTILPSGITTRLLPQANIIEDSTSTSITFSSSNPVQINTSYKFDELSSLSFGTDSIISSPLGTTIKFESGSTATIFNDTSGIDWTDGTPEPSANKTCLMFIWDNTGFYKEW